ncbi:MAG: SseB family protein [Rhodobacteraceae bacterium]|nr:SseB family protein [Paracoccaceae bacterium]
MQTPLDTAHQQMQEDESAAPAFYERFLEAELFLLLEEELNGDRAKPMILETSDGALALVFDLEERLAAFSDEAHSYVALSGRRVAGLLAGQGLGLGLNLGEAPSAMVLPEDAVMWLSEAAQNSDEQLEARPLEVFRPTGVPEALIRALDSKLANMGGVVSTAYLVSALYEGGEKGHMLALVNVPEPAKTGVSEALSEALRFSGIEAARLDLAFLAPDDPHLAKFKTVGLGFDIPELVLPKAPAPVAPGMDPDKPPVLR